MERAPAIIDGKEVETSATFVTEDPSTGEPLAEVARGGPGEIDAAVRAARTAFEGVWPATPTADRGRVLRTVAELIRRDRDELALLESRDTGKPLKQARADVDVAARYFEFYGGTLDAFYGDTIPISPELTAYTYHEPFGVTGHIVPWNYPIQISARTVAPALAVGNCCVLKPAEEAPLTAIRLAKLCLEAGLPAGAFNVVPGFGDEAGAPLAAHPGVDHVSFIGSVEVGRLVQKAAADNVVPVALELGGKSPNLVFADADLDAAVPVIVNSILQNAGQTCSAGSRLLVDERARDAVVSAIAERFAQVRIGPGPDDPDLGPLISKKQLERVTGFVESARDGARLVAGGSAPEGLGGGYFFSPTLFDGVSSDAPIAREEVFGPVLAVTSFRDPDEAIRLANATDFGLVAAVWTKDVTTAHRLARAIRAGQVYVNTYGAGGGVELPFGGFKRSGFGREKGFEALRTYSQVKTVTIRLPG
ncbi:MAG: aldehyde dehydrogenase family protein [Actinomycetota bacterium]